MTKPEHEDWSAPVERSAPFALLVQSLVALLFAGFAAWIFQPHIETLLRDHLDVGWSTLITDLYPPSLLDEQTFEDGWLFCETLLRVSIASLLALMCHAALRRKPGLLNQYTPAWARNRFRILALGCRFRVRLSILSAVLILTPLVFIYADLRFVEKRMKAVAEENRLHPRPLSLTSAERQALGPPITSSSRSGFVFNYELTGTNTICPVHSVLLRRQSVPILRGPITYPGWQLLEGFPYGRLSVPGGCVGITGRSQVAVLRCTNCVALNERYCGLSEYHAREAWKAQQDQWTNCVSPNFVRDSWNDLLSKLRAIF